MNKCFLIGNLTRDPELVQTQSGVSLCRFGIAVNRNRTNANGERETDFFNITTFRGLADNCAKYLSKGRKVAIMGQIQITNGEDKEGNRRTYVDIVADDVEFLGTNGDRGGDNAERSYDRAERSAPKKVSELKPVEDDGLPF